MVNATGRRGTNKILGLASGIAKEFFNEIWEQWASIGLPHRVSKSDFKKHRTTAKTAAAFAPDQVWAQPLRRRLPPGNARLPCLLTAYDCVHRFLKVSPSFAKSMLLVPQ